MTMTKLEAYVLALFMFLASFTIYIYGEAIREFESEAISRGYAERTAGKEFRWKGQSK